MKGVVFLGDRKVELRDFPDPKPGPGEVVLAMKASGMCGSDLWLKYRASSSEIKKPVIGGHEPCGVVHEVGEGVSDDQARVGMRVMVHHYSGCGVCKHCRTGWPQLCRVRKTYGNTEHGGHAEYLKVPATTIIPLRDELTFEAGAAISCGTGTAYGALRRIDLSGAETIAIFGQGPVGLSATQLASAMGARVIALDMSEERLEIAKQFGAEVAINPKKEKPVQAIMDLTQGEGVEKTMECSGSPDARLAAVRSTRTWGKVGLVGEGGQLNVNVSTDLMRRQISIISSWTFSTAGQMECADFIAQRGIPVDKVFTHRFRLDQAAEAYRMFDKQAMGKGVFII